MEPSQFKGGLCETALGILMRLASVIRIDRPDESTSSDILSRYMATRTRRRAITLISIFHLSESSGKRSASISGKSPAGRDLLLKLISRVDVLIDPFRPGVLERMGLGPEECLQKNPKLIYARLTGYRPKGPYANAAGHDINYMALSGVLAV